MARLGPWPLLNELEQARRIGNLSLAGNMARIMICSTGHCRVDPVAD